MAHKVKRSAKSVDLPPRGHPNRDPITKAPGAHPVEVGIGSALGGAAAGLAAGTLAGPIGTVVGAVVGGVAGGYGGKAVGEAIDPTIQTRPAGRRAKAVTGRRTTTAAGGGRQGARAKRAASTRARATGTARGRGKAASRAQSRGDDRTKRGPRDRARVNVNEAWEVNYWSKRFGVTPAQLRQAVRKAGPLAKNVRRELGK